EVGRGLAGGGHIFGASVLQNLFRLLRPIGIVAVNRKKDAAALDPAFVSFGFIFRNAHADQRADDAAYRAADAHTRKGRNNWTCGNKGTDAGDREGADSSQPSYRPAERRP